MTSINETFVCSPIKDGELSSYTKSEFRRIIRNMMQHENYQVNIRRVGQISNSRYKYYFGHILTTAVEFYNKAGKYQIYITSTGETVPLDSATLHEALKRKYNPEIVEFTGNTVVVAGSTTKLSDSQFINNFQEQILADMSNDGIQFLDKDEYYTLLKQGTSSKHIAEMVVNN